MVKGKPDGVEAFKKRWDGTMEIIKTETGEKKQKTYASFNVIWDVIVQCNERQKYRYHIL